ncbi:MAG: ADP-ribosylglycohydrolase family protein [Thermoguttaceae bacterium]
MARSRRPTPEQFAGCLVGLAIGYAVEQSDKSGADGDPTDHPARSSDPAEKTPSPDRPLIFARQTQMAIAVAEMLVRRGEIRERELARTLAEAFDRGRGCGPDASRAGKAAADADRCGVVAAPLPDGHFDNSPALRAAPVGLLFCDDLGRVAKEAERSAVVTHAAPLEMDGARLLAIAVALAARGGPFRREKYLTELLHWARTEELKWQLGAVREWGPGDSELGSCDAGKGHRSVAAGIACFAGAPDDFRVAIARAAALGGQGPAAMTGAISGARLGLAGIPADMVKAMDRGKKGQKDLVELSDRLHRKLVALRAESPLPDGKTRRGPKHRWYQFSLLEMLLVTTIFAALLGILKLVYINQLWIDLGTVTLIGFNLLRAMAALREQAIENDLWDSRPEEEEKENPFADA